MRTIIILSVLLVGAFCASTIEQNLAKDLFGQWKLLHNKAYKTVAEEEHRFTIFLHNYIQILTHNQNNSSVTLALNQFADLTDGEFTAMHTGLVRRNRKNTRVANFSLTALPEKVDWRTKGAVNPVKNQLACGSCWAFSATGALEGFYFINKGQLESFSEQQLVDCVVKDDGCDGGLMIDAFEYTAESGIQRNIDYPYVARDQKCAFNASKAIKVNSGYANITSKNATALKAAIVNQPVSVAVQADQNAFRFYKSGVITSGCGAALNHGILAVGYDTFDGVEAFIVRNSWSTIWGNQGYAYIGTDASQNGGYGVCGILKDPSFPKN